MNASKTLPTLFLAAVCLAAPARAVQHGDLSPAARELVPETEMVRVTEQDGTVHEGTLVSEKDGRVVIRVRKSAALTMSRDFAGTDVKVESLPIDDVFAEKLLAVEIDTKQSLPAAEYTRLASLHEEFLERCAGHDRAGEARERLATLRKYIQYQQRGMERVDGEWLAPVQAAVATFKLYTEQVATLEGRSDVQSNPKVRKAIEMLTGKRDATARDLPGLMQTRIPKLLEARSFRDAVEETTSFLQFWIEQVVDGGSEAAREIRQMDFDYILRMQEDVMEAYRDAGQGREGPGQARIPGDMAYVPGGYFLMGSSTDNPGADNFPLRVVFVSPFVIDRYEVSNAEYRKFVDHVKSTGDYSMAHPDAPPLKKHEAEGWGRPELSGDKQPVMGVDWFDAYAYAKWAGKRLPTEAEWEKACRGMDGRRYTWGAGDPASTCSVNWAGGREFIAREMDRQNPPRPPQEQFGCGCVKEQELAPPPPTTLPQTTWDVDKLLPPRARAAIENDVFEWTEENLSPYGLYHMAGNAAEWVQDVYSVSYYKTSPIYDPPGPSPDDPGAAPDPAVHVYRGGSYLDTSPTKLTTYWRGRGGSGQPTIGFRCARSLNVTR